MNLRPLEKKAIAEVKAYVDVHFKENLSVQVLAAREWCNGAVRFRTRRLHDGFIAVFLQSVHTYHIQIRLETAKTLLETTDLSVKAIAISVGYKNDSSFGSVFKKHFGITPTVYRDSWIIN
jgi:two-component system response regulator YesN